MKITKTICPEPIEVDVSVTTEDMLDALNRLSTEQRWHIIADGLNACSQFMKAVEADSIAAMNPAQKATIRAFLMEQAERYT